MTETEWVGALSRYRDGSYPCAKCGSGVTYDDEALRESGGVPPACWACKALAPAPARIRVGRGVVALPVGARLYPHQVDPARRFDFGQPVAEVAARPGNAAQLGLKNLSGEKWTLTSPGGAVADVPPGRSVNLIDGAKIHLGRCDGEVRV